MATNPSSAASVHSFSARPLTSVPLPGSPQKAKRIRERLRGDHGMPAAAASAVSDAVVDADRFLRKLAEPELVRVPGGWLQTVTDMIYAARAIADPANPRVAVDLPYPAAAEPGSNSRMLHRPLPLPRSGGPGELVVEADELGQLAWQLGMAMDLARAENMPWPPIAEQGVLDPVFAVPTTFRFADGGPALTVLVTGEGSTRLSHVHALLGLTPLNVLGDLQRLARLRQHLEDVNAVAALAAGEGTEQAMARLRVAAVPATIIIGLVPDPGAAIDLAQAVRARVAQDHINHKQQWRPVAQDGMLGDDVLTALADSGLLKSAEEAEWLAGRLTPLGAARAKLGKFDDDRFARLMWLCTTKNRSVRATVRRPIALALERQNRTVRIKKRERLVRIAVALYLRRGLGSGPADKQALARLYESAMPAGLWERSWKASGVSPSADRLLASALAELGTSAMAARLELIVRAACYLVRYRQISGPRHDLGDRVARREAWQVLLDAAVTERGLRQLAQAVTDGRERRAAAQIGSEKDHFAPLQQNDGNPKIVDDAWLRTVIAPAADAPPADPREAFLHYKEQFRQDLSVLRETSSLLASQLRDDEQPFVEAEGIDEATAELWLKELEDLTRAVRYWEGRGLRFAAAQ